MHFSNSEYSSFGNLIKVTSQKVKIEKKNTYKYKFTNLLTPQIAYVIS